MEDEARQGTRRLARVVGVLGVLLAAATAGIAWYFADQLTLPPDYYPYPAETEVLAADGDTVTLPRARFADVPGTWGLQVDGRTVQLTEQLSLDADTVTWRWEGDAFTPRAGDAAKIDEYVWATDPFDAHGLLFGDVSVEGPDGFQLPAWFVPAVDGPVGTVVFVHGRGATRAESLRFLPALVEAGWDVLVPTYRGDEGAGPLADGRMRFGTHEWVDLRAAVQHVADRDGPLVVFGASMGGAMTAQLLEEDPGMAALVDAVVLDSPLLSMNALLDLQAGLNGLPAPTEPIILPLVQLIADQRFTLRSGSLEHGPDTFPMPVLLFHADEDAFVPFDASLALAEAAPDRVTWFRVPEAGHVRSWNYDREGYEQALRSFLRDVVAP